MIKLLVNFFGRLKNLVLITVVIFLIYIGIVIDVMFDFRYQFLGKFLKGLEGHIDAEILHKLIGNAS